MNGRERVLTFLQGGKTDCLPLMPITMMFAADRIGRSYGDYASDYRVLADAQAATASEFDFDYVSAISDPAREAADCGAEIEFFQDQPPAIKESNALLSDKSRLVALRVPDPALGKRMSDRLEAIALLKRHCGREKLVEGWIEGPCAESADLRGINHLMMDFHDDPGFVNDLMEFVLEMEIGFARAQVAAGADLIGVGDAAASLVGPRIYQQFVLPFQRRMVNALHALGTKVRLHICGDTRPILEGMGSLGCEIVDLDYPSPMALGRTSMGPDQVLLGNLNPVLELLHGTPQSVSSELAKCWREAGPRYIVGAGCEVPRGTPPGNLHAMKDFAGSHGGSSGPGSDS